MELSDFDFSLPDSLIAKYPTSRRRESRLMLLNRKTGEIRHHHFFELPNLLNEGDLLVLNDSKVVPARLFTQKETGGKVEILLERKLSERSFSAISKSNRPLKVKDFCFKNEQKLQLIEKQEEISIFQILTECSVDQLFNTYGEIPLPPYLKRGVEPEDRIRYQTIYAKMEGSSAAPTAGLHFDETIFQNLQARNIDWDYLTLHVGLGTFKPIKPEQLISRKLHSERFFISEKLIQSLQAKKGRIIPVGTTSLRALETLTTLNPYQGESNLFIYPGYSFKIIDGLLTNFHLPKTSLLMLVCALGGYQKVMNAYQEAIKHHYRFFSYGDAMLIL